MCINSAKNIQLHHVHSKLNKNSLGVTTHYFFELCEETSNTRNIHIFNVCSNNSYQRIISDAHIKILIKPNKYKVEEL